MPRAAVIVLDACGVGALPDADLYQGDAGSNTLGHLAERVGGLDLPALGRLGLGSIIPIEGVPPAADPVVHGRLHPLGPGKDSQDLRDQSVGDLIRTASDFTRKQPALVFGLASLAGFLAFRVLKSSPPESAMEHDPMTERFEGRAGEFHGA